MFSQFFSQLWEAAEGAELRRAERPAMGGNVLKEMDEFLRFPESGEQTPIPISEGRIPCRRPLHSLQGGSA